MLGRIRKTGSKLLCWSAIAYGGMAAFACKFRIMGRLHLPKASGLDLLDPELLVPQEQSYEAARNHHGPDDNKTYKEMCDIDVVGEFCAEDCHVFSFWSDVRLDQRRSISLVPDRGIAGLFNGLDGSGRISGGVPFRRRRCPALPLRSCLYSG